jgi:hypothetical protein
VFVRVESADAPSISGFYGVLPFARNGGRSRSRDRNDRVRDNEVACCGRVSAYLIVPDAGLALIRALICQILPDAEDCEDKLSREIART